MPKSEGEKGIITLPSMTPSAVLYSVTPNNRQNQKIRACHPNETSRHVLFYFIYLFIFTKLQLIYNAVAAPVVQVSDPVIYTHTFFFSYYHPSCSITRNGYNSLCCTTGPHCLSILNVIVRLYYPQTPSPSHPIPRTP